MTALANLELTTITIIKITEMIINSAKYVDVVKATEAMARGAKRKSLKTFFLNLKFPFISPLLNSVWLR